jgi:hypothetical protein
MARFQRMLGLTMLGLVTAGTSAVAQTTTTGIVEGIVRDATGRPVEGVKVRLVSSQVTRTATSGAEGRFHAGLLNPGEWQLTLEKAGYETLSSRVSVVPEESTPVRFRLAEVAAATVEVTGSPAMVSLDPTSTSSGTTLTRDEIERLPVGRNMNDLVYLAPSAGYAGTPWNKAVGMDYSISGASGAENQFLADGLVTTDMRYGGQGLFLVPEFVESMQVQTSSFKPENSALGGVFNTVIRSGSNAFRGDTWATWSPSGLEAKAKSSAAGFRQPAPADRYDLGFGAGGAFVKDRFFYFVGLDWERQRERPYPNSSGLQGNDRDTGTTQTIVKLNGFLTPEQQLSATWITTERKEQQPLAYPDGYGDANFGYERTFQTRNIILGYDQSFGPRLLLSVKVGASWRKDETQPSDPGTPSIQDDYWFSGGGGGNRPELASYSYFRGGRGPYGYEQADTTQFKVDLSWFTGRHAFKGGLSYMSASYRRQDFTTGPAGDNLTYYIFPDASVIETVWTGIFDPVEVKASYQTFYLQDTWELNSRFRAICGVRTERQEQRDATGLTRLRFTDMGRYLQPRLGFTWDADGDGRTLLTGAYAVYFEQMPQRATLRAWGGDLLTVADYALTSYSSSGLGSFDANSPIGGWSWTPNALQVIPGVRLPKRQEWSLGLEKTLPKGLTGSFHGLFRHLTDGLDSSVLFDREGNPYFRWANGNVIHFLWNPQSSLTLVAPAGAIDKDGQSIGGQTLTISNTLFPEAWNKYAALTLGLSQRTERFFWNATYTWSHLWGTYDGLAQPDRGTGGTPDSNLSEAFDAWSCVGTGDLGYDRRHSFKFFGSHRFRFSGLALNVGGRWTWQSGLNLSLRDDGSTTLGLPPGTLGAGNPLDPLGLGGLTFDHGLAGNRGHSPAVSVADLHLDLEFKTGKVTWTPTLDIYNLFNSRTATAVHQMAAKWWSGAPDSRYGEAMEWLQGRRLQFGLKARF